jgi:hypothetical protein
MKTEQYNGWTNFETWNAALWLNNDQGSQSLCEEMAQECYDQEKEDDTFTRLENATSELADRLRALFEEQAAESPSSGWMADAINTYLSEVNFHEIAKSFMEDVEQDEEQEQTED